MKDTERPTTYADANFFHVVLYTDAIKNVSVVL